jgi:hypothetical protein
MKMFLIIKVRKKHIDMTAWFDDKVFAQPFMIEILFEFLFLHWNIFSMAI